MSQENLGIIVRVVGGEEGGKEREGIATTGRVPFQSRALVNSVGTSGECNRIGKKTCAKTRGGLRRAAKWVTELRESTRPTKATKGCK